MKAFFKDVHLVSLGGFGQIADAIPQFVAGKYRILGFLSSSDILGSPPIVMDSNSVNYVKKINPTITPALWPTLVSEKEAYYVWDNCIKYNLYQYGSPQILAYAPEFENLTLSAWNVLNPNDNFYLIVGLY